MKQRTKARTALCPTVKVRAANPLGKFGKLAYSEELFRCKSQAYASSIIRFTAIYLNISKPKMQQKAIWVSLRDH
jgi:hypothetical protein